MTDFIVTALAGAEVAGLPNPGAGEGIKLTEQQAEHPLRLGHISRPVAPAPQPKNQKPPKE